MTEAKPTSQAPIFCFPDRGEGRGWGAKLLRLCGFYGMVIQEFYKRKSNLHSLQIKTVIVQTTSYGGFVLPETPKQKFKRERSAIRYHRRFGHKKILGKGRLGMTTGFNFIENRFPTFEGPILTRPGK